MINLIPRSLTNTCPVRSLSLCICKTSMHNENLLQKEVFGGTHSYIIIILRWPSNVTLGGRTGCRDPMVRYAMQTTNIPTCPNQLLIVSLPLYPKANPRERMHSYLWVKWNMDWRFVWTGDRKVEGSYFVHCIRGYCDCVLVGLTLVLQLWGPPFLCK